MKKIFDKAAAAAAAAVSCQRAPQEVSISEIIPDNAPAVPDPEPAPIPIVRSPVEPPAIFDPKTVEEAVEVLSDQKYQPYDYVFFRDDTCPEKFSIILQSSDYLFRLFFVMDKRSQDSNPTFNFKAKKELRSLLGEENEEHDYHVIHYDRELDEVMKDIIRKLLLNGQILHKEIRLELRAEAKWDQFIEQTVDECIKALTLIQKCYILNCKLKRYLPGSKTKKMTHNRIPAKMLNLYAGHNRMEVKIQTDFLNEQEIFNLLDTFRKERFCSFQLEWKDEPKTLAGVPEVSDKIEPSLPFQRLHDWMNDFLFSRVEINQCVSVKNVDAAEVEKCVKALMRDVVAHIPAFEMSSVKSDMTVNVRMKIKQRELKDIIEILTHRIAGLQTRDNRYANHYLFQPRSSTIDEFNKSQRSLKTRAREYHQGVALYHDSDPYDDSDTFRIIGFIAGHEWNLPNFESCRIYIERRTRENAKKPKPYVYQQGGF